MVGTRAIGPGRVSLRDGLPCLCVAPSTLLENVCDGRVPVWVKLYHAGRHVDGSSVRGTEDRRRTGLAAKPVKGIGEWGYASPHITESYDISKANRLRLRGSSIIADSRLGRA